MMFFMGVSWWGRICANKSFSCNILQISIHSIPSYPLDPICMKCFADIHIHPFPSTLLFTILFFFQVVGDPFSVTEGLSW